MPELELDKLFKNQEENSATMQFVEGFNKGMIEVAKKMINAKKPIREIIDFTGLPEETVQQLLQ
ncbi:MAG: hypothetical protein H7A23_04875 [Leptospiraceae bacterium]|nr:hypothetical protein [Leptospiraceae bacterium]MCP5493869.1 hypothetical protein [Leptospiraceae bacterium]